MQQGLSKGNSLPIMRTLFFLYPFFSQRSPQALSKHAVAWQLAREPLSCASLHYGYGLTRLRDQIPVQVYVR